MESEFFIASTAIIFSLGVLPGSILYFIHRVAAKKLDTIVRVVDANLPHHQRVLLSSFLIKSAKA